MGDGHVQAPGTHDFPEQEETQQILAGRHADEPAAHAGEGAVKAPLVLAVLHIAHSIGHVHRAQQGNDQREAEGKRIQLPPEEQHQKGRQQQHSHAGPACRLAAVGEQGRKHGAEHRQQHINGPGDVYRRNALQGVRRGRIAKRGHGQRQRRDGLREQAQQQADGRQNQQARAHAEGRFFHPGQMVRPFFKNQGFQNAGVVHGPHQ